MMNSDDIKKLAAEISKQVTENVNQYLDEEKNDKEEDDPAYSTWLVNENTMVCKPCLLYAKCPERPLKYAKFYKANFGTFDLR